MFYSGTMVRICEVTQLAPSTFALIPFISELGAYLSDAYTYSISNQQWSTIPTTGMITRGNLGAGVDDRNMVYFFGGFNGASGR